MAGLGMSDPNFTGSVTWSFALGVSADGNVVVGEADNQAFRWTSGGGMRGIGFLIYGLSSRANAVSADGSVVVGYSNDGTTSQAFRWTQATNMQSVQAWLGGGGCQYRHLELVGSHRRQRQRQCGGGL